MRAVPGSMTYLMPGTVRDVSATLVARTIRAAWRPGEDARAASASDNRANKGRIWPCAPAAVGFDPAVQRVRGVADLALAGEEDQDVAGSFQGELVDGVAHGVERVPVFLLLPPSGAGRSRVKVVVILASGANRRPGWRAGGSGFPPG